MTQGSTGEPEPTTRRRPTIRDIGAEAGVSKALVSMILSGTPGPSAETTARVLAIADRLGYRTNRTASLLARRRTQLLGVTMEPSNVFHGELVEEIQTAARERGYEIVLGVVTRSHNERRVIESLLGFRCEALLLLGSDLASDEIATLIDGVPTVSVGRPVELPGVDVVRTADLDGMALLVDHLVDLGHRRVTHIDGGEGVVSAERRRAYGIAMLRNGLEPVVVPGGPVERDGLCAVNAMDLTAGTTAIVAFNDRCALGVLDALDRARILVPEQISVTGYDDSLVAQLTRINLTTVNQELVEQAQLAVAMAIERLEGHPVDRQERILKAVLVKRGSTAQAPERTP